MCDKLKCQFCGRECATSSGKGHHERSCKLNPNCNPVKQPFAKEGGWECQSCHNIFRTRRELESHLSENPDHKVDNRHKNCVWHCDYCDSYFKNRRSLYAHYKVCEEKNKLPHDSNGHVISQKVLDGREARVKTIKSLVDSGVLEYKGHPHSEETKKRLSIARRNNIANGIGSTWINPSIKRSYAEQYFFDIFSKEGIQFDSNKWIGSYCVDFLFGNYYLEVDGEQHYTEDGIQHDRERDCYLSDKGYFLISRIRWSTYKAMKLDMKTKFVNDLLAKIRSVSN